METDFTYTVHAYIPRVYRYLFVLVRERVCQLGRESALTNPAFSRQHDDDVFDAGEPLGDRKYFGVRAFGGGRANLLVGTTFARAAFARLVTLGARAIFNYGK